MALYQESKLSCSNKRLFLINNRGKNWHKRPLAIWRGIRQREDRAISIFWHLETKEEMKYSSTVSVVFERLVTKWMKRVLRSVSVKIIHSCSFNCSLINTEPLVCQKLQFRLLQICWALLSLYLSAHVGFQAEFFHFQRVSVIKSSGAGGVVYRDKPFCTFLTFDILSFIKPFLCKFNSALFPCQNIHQTSGLLHLLLTSFVCLSYVVWWPFVSFCSARHLFFWPNANRAMIM